MFFAGVILGKEAEVTLLLVEWTTNLQRKIKGKGSELFIKRTICTRCHECEDDSRKKLPPADHSAVYHLGRLPAPLTYFRFSHGEDHDINVSLFPSMNLVLLGSTSRH